MKILNSKGLIIKIRFELLDWARFFLKEMKNRKIQIERKVLDEFLKLNLVVKTMKMFCRKEENAEFKRLNGSDYLKYRFSKAGFRRIRHIFNSLQRKKMNVSAEEFHPSGMIKKPKKDLSLNSFEFIPINKKN